MNIHQRFTKRTIIGDFRMMVAFVRLLPCIARAWGRTSASQCAVAKQPINKYVSFWVCLWSWQPSVRQPTYLLIDDTWFVPTSDNSVQMFRKIDFYALDWQLAMASLNKNVFHQDWGKRRLWRHQSQVPDAWRWMWKVSLMYSNLCACGLGTAAVLGINMILHD